MRIVKFEKKDCAPCVQVDNYLKHIGIAEHVEHIMAFDKPEKTAALQVKSLPTIIVFNTVGVEIFRTFGFKEKELDKLKEFIDETIIIQN